MSDRNCYRTRHQSLAVKAVTATVFSQKAVARDIIAMFKMNQVKGFDCPCCAWPDPGLRAPMGLCENVSWETTSKKASPAFFSRHTVSTLWQYSDYALENIGRVTHPMKYDAVTDTRQAVEWDIALQETGERLHSYDYAEQVEFYTSGRTSWRQVQSVRTCQKPTYCCRSMR